MGCHLPKTIYIIKKQDMLSQVVQYHSSVFALVQLVVGSLWGPFTGRDELPHECTLVPGVRVQQHVEVGSLLARHAERRVRVPTRAQLRHRHSGVTQDITDALFDVLHRSIRMESSHEHVETLDCYHT